MENFAIFVIDDMKGMNAMKIGLISDMYGNKKALDAVLEQLENENIDKIICLGDLIGGVPMSEEVVQKIISMGKK